jgi:TfoX/Sxy family transcriptional regulator of competence genes
LVLRGEPVPYNLDLETKLDSLTPDLGSFTKKKMFGGVGYLSSGKMVFGIHKHYLLLRISPEQGEELLKKDSAKPFDMTRRPMRGWILVSPESLRTEKQLADLLNMAINYATTLPQ